MRKVDVFYTITVANLATVANQAGQFPLASQNLEIIILLTGHSVSLLWRYKKPCGCIPWESTNPCIKSLKGRVLILFYFGRADRWGPNREVLKY